MRRNTITIIELIIILCVIVVAVRVCGGYKRPENKALSIPTPIHKSTVIPATKNELCPMCGKNKLIYIDYLKVPYTGDIYTGKVCTKCDWCSFKCPTCGSDLTTSIEQYSAPGQPNTFNCNFVCFLYVKCKKCDWKSESVQVN
jgi:C4-type Zn-finger protein